jgi:hypothetical protein
MLPMIAGAGLMMIPGMQAGAAGLIVGGLQTARTGSLSKGIMAGLGAYGGAGLANSFGTAGAVSQAAPSAGQAVAADTDAIARAAQATQTTGAIPSIAQTTNVGGSLASSDQAFNAATQGGINGNTLTNAESFGASNPNAGIPAAQPVQIAPQGGTTFPGESAMQGTSYAGPDIPKDFNAMNASERFNAMKSGASFGNAYDFAAANPKTAIGAGLSVASGMKKDPTKVEPDKDMGQRYSFTGGKLEPTPAPDVRSYEDMLTKQGNYGRQQRYFNSPTYTAISPTAAKDLYNFADGGPVEQMSNNAAMGANTMYPMANMATSSFATPYQTPQSTNMLANMAPSGGGAVNMMSGEPSMQGTRMAEGGEAESRPSYTYDPQAQKYTAGPPISEGAPNEGFLASVARSFGVRQEEQNPALKYTYNPQSRQYQQMASGGISDAGYNLGGYSDGGRLLRGPGDGVSDSIPAVIGKKQPARLADGEFVVPARIVSELGNGSTEAGARKLYAMMDRIQAARKKTVGKNKVAHNSRSSKYLPA